MTDQTLAFRPWAGSWLTVVALVVSAVAFVIATGFVPATTRYFPQVVSAACMVMALADLAKRAFAAWRSRSGVVAESRPMEAELINTAASASPAAVVKYALWFFGFLVGIWLVSLIVASGLFVAAFLWREAHLRWWMALLSGAVVVGLVVFAGNVLLIRWPASLVDPLGPLL